MKVTRNTIKNARSGNTFWRVLVHVDRYNKIVADIERRDLIGSKVIANLGFEKECRTVFIGKKGSLWRSSLNDIAGHSPSVQTFTQEKQAKKFAFEIENEPHLHPEAIRDAILHDRVSKMFDQYYSDMDYDWN